MNTDASPKRIVVLLALLAVVGISCEGADNGPPIDQSGNLQPATLHEKWPAARVPTPAAPPVAAVPPVVADRQPATVPVEPSPGLAAPRSFSADLPPAESSAVADLVVPQAVLTELAPDELLVTMAADDPAACGVCACPQEGCGCRPLRSGECLCVTIEGGADCSCTCRGAPSVVRQINVGSTGTPTTGPSMELP